MESGSPLTGEEVNRFRSEGYSHQQSLGTRSYAQEYKGADTVEDISELFHENTKLDGKIRANLKTTASDLAGSLPGIIDRIDPDYPDRERHDLPDPPTLDASFGEVIENRESPSDFERASISAMQLSQFLHYATGGRADVETSRTYPSPGRLYPTELFVLLADVTGYEPGLYYYNVDGHYLRQHRTFPDGTAALERIRECIFTGGVVPDLDKCAMLVLLTGAFWRAKFKYGPRGYRYVLQESGHIAQNMLTTLTAMGLTGRPMAAFRDGAMNEFLEIDGVDEAVVYSIAAGRASTDGGADE